MADLDSGKGAYSGPVTFTDVPSLPSGDDLYSEANFSPETLNRVANEDSPENAVHDTAYRADEVGTSHAAPTIGPAAPLSAESLTTPLARLMLESDELEACLVINSADQLVAVSINVAGRLRSISINEDSLRNVHSSQLARSVQQAVNSARMTSASRAVELAIHHYQEDGIPS